MKLVSVVGARPQFVKLAPIARASAQAGIDHIIVHTGQHYDALLSDVFFDDLKIPAPDFTLGVGSGTHGRQTGAMLAGLDEVFEDVRPDVVLAYGDTNSTLAAAVSAVKMGIGLAHLEAGLRSFNRRMPEEHNRVLTDHASDLLLAPTLTAVEHLRREGLAEKTEFVGDVMTDVLLEVAQSAASDSAALLDHYAVRPGEYYVATIHRSENTDDPERLTKIVSGLAAAPLPVLLLTHPRLKAKADAFGIDLQQSAVRVHEPAAYPQLVGLAREAKGVITDSGGLQKEAFLLRTPCTTVRTETEWVETVDLGWNTLVADPADLSAALARPAPEPTEATPYGDGHAAESVVDVLQRRFGG